MGTFFSKYGKVEEVNTLIRKSGTTTGDMVLQVILSRKSFGEMCREKRIMVVVEGRRPYFWSCGAPGHISKLCPAKKSQPPPRPTIAISTTTSTEEGAVKTPDGAWMEVKRG